MLEVDASRTMTAISPMAKEVLYHSPSSLLTKRRNSGGNGLTVAIPFTFSTRLARNSSKIHGLESSRVRSGDRRSPQPTPLLSGRRSKTPSLPKLTPQPSIQQQPQHSHHRQRLSRQMVSSARPSEAASKSTNSGSAAKRAGSGCEHHSLYSGSKDRTSQCLEGGATAPYKDDVDVLGSDDPIGDIELDNEELEEKRLTEAKCRQWLDGLPDKFSGMHIVQQTLYTAHR